MNILSVSIQTIPHEQQMYDTVGDWRVTGTQLSIFVSDTGFWFLNMAVALHELVEALLCIYRDIEERDVSKFDMLFERNRKEGNDDEPGDEPTSPYHKEHSFATGVERLFISVLGLSWKEYEQALDEL